jgi:hypothetical protein
VKKVPEVEKETVAAIASCIELDRSRAAHGPDDLGRRILRLTLLILITLFIATETFFRSAGRLPEFR